MALPQSITDRLDIPLMAAPMFLASNPELVIQCCINGIIGSFPAKNQRSLTGWIAGLPKLGMRLKQPTHRQAERQPPMQ